MYRQDGTYDLMHVEGAFKKPRRLHFQKDEKGLHHCPVAHYGDHPGFSSCLVCRNHVKTKHPWYAYFDEKTKVVVNKVEHIASAKPSRAKVPLPCCSSENEFARSFSLWLQSTMGGTKALKPVEISFTRALKFLKFLLWTIRWRRIDSAVGCWHYR